MDDGDRQKILVNIDKLIQLTEYNALMDRCLKSELLFNQMKENIEMTSDESVRHRQLIEKITHRGPHAFKKFIDILNFSFPEAHRILDVSYRGVDLSLREQKMHPLSNSYVPVQQPSVVTVASAMIAPRSELLPASAPRNEPLPRMNGAASLPNRIVPALPDFGHIAPIDVGGGLKLEYFTKDVMPRRKFSVKLSNRVHTAAKISTYNMTSAKRGLLFLVNIINFKKKETLRNGASVDRDNLISLFRQMNFQIMYYEDITKAQFFALLNKFVTSPFLRGIDCLVFGVLSHGDEDFGRTTVHFHDETAEINDIIAKFNNANCLKLLGKPKIFLFPFCRGPISDHGVNSHVQAFTHRTESDSSYSSRPEDARETNVATFSDIKICYGTLPGFRSFRDPSEGSWYIQVLCDVFAEHAHDTHLDDLLKIVGNTLSQRRTEDMSIQTISNTDRGFFKSLYFNPGFHS